MRVSGQKFFVPAIKWLAGMARSYRFQLVIPRGLPRGYALSFPLRGKVGMGVGSQ